MLFIQNLTYTHPNKDLLFDNITISLQQHQKTALIGHNGVGKSTLLQIIAGKLPSSGGIARTITTPFYIPQLYGQYDELTVAEALQIDDRLNAFYEILKGKLTEKNYTLLNDDWTIEERCKEALHYWQLPDMDILTTKIAHLSGGQKTKVFLAGMSIHQPECILLDEPSNHLDSFARELLYEYIRAAKCTMLVVSHDRKLINLMDSVCELHKNGAVLYGGNYDFYKAQKELENNALQLSIANKERAVKKAKEKERETLERQQKMDARGKSKQEKSGMPKIMMDKMKNDAEKSTAKIKSVHTEKINTIAKELQELRNTLPEWDKMRLTLDNAHLHKGKLLTVFKGVNFQYPSCPFLWATDLNFEIVSGERIALNGSNGSGKTTLIQLLLQKQKPGTGSITTALTNSLYIDQEYSLLRNDLTVYEQAQAFNISALQEHEIKMRLSRFLFSKADWDKSCQALSGGEKMRLLLCALTIRAQAPDMIILDEPTNNLDIQNLEILTQSLNSYQGTLLIVSHDSFFLQEIGITRTIFLS